MTVPKVFAVFSDNMSSCEEDGLLKIYLTEEEAKEAVSLYTDKTYYLEWVIDNLPEHPKGYKAFSVSHSGTITIITQFNILKYPNFLPFFPSVTESTVYCWAIDEDHAKEVAFQMLNNHE